MSPSHNQKIHFRIQTQIQVPPPQRNDHSKDLVAAALPKMPHLGRTRRFLQHQDCNDCGSHRFRMRLLITCWETPTKLNHCDQSLSLGTSVPKKLIEYLIFFRSDVLGEDQKSYMSGFWLLPNPLHHTRQRFITVHTLLLPRSSNGHH